MRELQLLEGHREGNEEATAALLESYLPRVYSICYRMLRNAEEARDVSQDTMVKLLEGLDSYDERARLSTWVIRVAMNAALSHLRREKLRKHTSLESPLVDTSDEPSAGPATLAGALADEAELSPQQRIEQADRAAMIEQALGQLDPESRALLVLRDTQDLEYQQISEVLDVPLGTVKSRLFRARAALKQICEQQMTGEEESGRP